MAKQRKVIFISGASEMYKSKKEMLVSKDPINWQAKAAVQVYNRSDKYLLEVWGVENFVKKPITFERDGLKHRYFPCHGLRPFKTFSPELIKALKKECENNEVIIHMHTYESWLGYSIFKNFSDVPIVAQHHGGTRPLLLLVRRPQYFWTLPILLWEEICERLYFKNIDRFFVISPVEKEYRSKWLDPQKIEMLSMGLDFEKFKPMDKRMCRKRLGLPLNKKLMLFIGPHWRYDKGLGAMVEAYLEIKKKRKDIEFVTVGGKPGDEINEYVKKNVKYDVGRVPNSETVYYYNAADVYVMFCDKKATKYGGFGVAPAEALACGTPIVSTNLFNMQDKDMAKCGKQFWKKEEFIPAVYSVLDHPEKYKNCREIARRHYDWASVVKRTVEVYDELFEQYYN